MGKIAKTIIIKDKVGSLMNRAGYRGWVWSNKAESVKENTLYTVSNATKSLVYDETIEAIYSPI